MLKESQGYFEDMRAKYSKSSKKYFKEINICFFLFAIKKWLRTIPFLLYVF